MGYGHCNNAFHRQGPALVPLRAAGQIVPETTTGKSNRA